MNYLVVVAHGEEEIEDFLNKKIDYEKVNQTIDIKRQESLLYLEKALIDR